MNCSSLNKYANKVKRADIEIPKIWNLEILFSKIKNVNITIKLKTNEIKAAIIKLKYCVLMKKPVSGTISKKNALRRI